MKYAHNVRRVTVHHESLEKATSRSLIERERVNSIPTLSNDCELGILDADTSRIEGRPQRAIAALERLRY